MIEKPRLLDLASPPCQGYVDRNKNRESRHPKLIDPTRDILKATGKPYVIENVVGAPYLLASVMLCGTMFGLPLIRHRFFETSFPGPFSPFHCYHKGTCQNGDIIGVYAFGPHGKRDANGFRGKPKPPKYTKSQAMGIDWMVDKELHEAIPPVYTEYIGKFLMEAVMEKQKPRSKG